MEAIFETGLLLKQERPPAQHLHTDYLCVGELEGAKSESEARDGESDDEYQHHSKKPKGNDGGNDESLLFSQLDVPYQSTSCSTILHCDQETLSLIVEDSNATIASQLDDDVEKEILQMKEDTVVKSNEN
jgi:hypothetical protein